MQLNCGFRHAQRGVGLVEVLIAVLVLSFGMLGLVGLQTWSLRNNQSALERGMATVQTHSIVDAMRADRANALTYNIAIDDATPAAPFTDYRDQAIFIWREGLQDALNETATGSVDCDNSGGRVICNIVVRWNDQRAQGDLAQAAFQITTQVEL